MEKLNPNNIPLTPPEQYKDWTCLVTPEAENTGKDFLIENYRDFIRTSNYGWISDKGLITAYIGKACHAGNSSVPKNRSHLIATENGAHRVNLSKDVYEGFLSWLLYRSPYSQYIYNRDDFEFCSRYGFLISGDTPQPILQNICITTRHFVEIGKSCFEAFNELVSKGIDEFVAYNFCFLTNISSYSEEKERKKYLVSGVYNHRAAACYNYPSLLNVYKGNLKNSSMVPFKEFSSTSGGSRLWKQDTSSWIQTARQQDKELDKLIREYRGESVENVEIYRPPNPFKVQKSTPASNQITLRETLDVLVPYYDRKLREDVTKK